MEHWSVEHAATRTFETDEEAEQVVSEQQIQQLSEKYARDPEN